MKIKRVNDSEKYNITADWINDFANNIEKKGNYLDRIQERRDFRVEEKFATIEDKMIDIKQRIGFVQDLSNTINKSASGCNCGTCPTCVQGGCQCGSCDQCKMKDAKDYVINILNYIKNMLMSEPHLMPVEVISRCRSEYPKFSSYESMMDYDKLKKYINNMRAPKAMVKFDHIPKEDIHNFLPEDEGVFDR